MKSSYREARLQAEREAAAVREAEKAARVTQAFTTGPLATAAQHIRLIQQRRDRLANVMVDAQLQFLAVLAREHTAGNATYAQLRDGYDLLSAAKIPGLQQRWYAEIGVSIERVRAHAGKEPREEDGSWRGSNPLAPGENYPVSGQSVVYVLFDENHMPVYVGSTLRFRVRMDQHRQAGKSWRYWLAHPCRDRAHAYEVEARFLRQYMPALNVQGPRR